MQHPVISVCHFVKPRILNISLLGVMATVVRRMNEVAVHWARLVLEWVTVFGWVYHHGV